MCRTNCDSLMMIKSVKLWYLVMRSGSGEGRVLGKHLPKMGDERL